MDYRVKITIRNNRILKTMEEKGYPSVAAFCKKNALPYMCIVSIINGQKKPLKKNGELSSNVVYLLDLLNLNVEEAFTERQLKGFNKNSFQVEMNEKQLSSLTTKNVELLAMEGEVHSTLKNLMIKILTPREERIVRECYLENKSILDLSKEFSISRARTDQILKKSLIKLSRHYHVLDKSGIKEVFPAVDKINRCKIDMLKKEAIKFMRQDQAKERLLVGVFQEKI